MKKAFKSAAIAALAISAITPVAASAATEDVSNGIYTTEGFYSIADFKKLSTTKKAALLTSPKAALVVNGQALPASIIVTGTDAQIDGSYISLAAYEQQYNVSFNSGTGFGETPQAGELKVESVSAINANELQVKFNKEVDSKTATDPANYIFSVNSTRYGQTAEGYTDVATLLQAAVVGPPAVSAVNLSADKKTVTFKVLDTKVLKSGDKYGVDVKDSVLSADGQTKVDRYGDTQKVFEDRTAPKLASTTISAGKNLVLTFDEHVNVGSAFTGTDAFVVTVNGTPVPMTAPAAAGVLDYKVISTSALTADQLKTGKYDVKVYNARDFAANNGTVGNVAPLITSSYEIKAGEAPAVKSIEAVDFNSFKITFTEEVKNATVVVVKDGVEFHNKVELPALASSVTVNLPVTVVSATTGLTKLYADNSTTTAVSVTVKNYSDNESLIGNSSTQAVTLKRDAANPAAKGTSFNTIDAAAAVDPATVKVPLNRGSNVIADASKITVTDKNGVVRTIATPTLTDSGTGTNVADILNFQIIKTAATPMTKAEVEQLAPFTVNFGANALSVKTDLIDAGALSGKPNAPSILYAAGDNTNVLYNLAHTTTVNTANSNAYKYVEAVATGGVVATSALNAVTGLLESKITVTYKEEMSAEATKLANYTIDGKPLPAGSTISVDGEGKVVTILLGSGTFKNDTSTKLVISDAVTTKLGSHVVASVSTKDVYRSDLLTFKDDVAPVLESAKFVVAAGASETDTLELTFSENIAIGASALENFVVIAHDGTKYPVDVATVAAAGKTVKVTLTTPAKVNTAQTVKVYVQPKAETVAGVAQALVDAAGNLLKEGTTVTVSGTVAP